MRIISTGLSGVSIIEPDVYHDARGFFLETLNPAILKAIGDVSFVQDNHSHSKKHVLRGLHYQLNHPQGKLVRVVAGSVYDAAVGVRRGSPTFGRYEGTRFSSANHHMLWIPPGFAHGFLTLSETADLQYKVTAAYDPKDERTIKWDDPEIGIDRPLEGTSPLISDKDAHAGSLSDADAV